MRSIIPCILCVFALAACSRVANVGQAPKFSPVEGTYQQQALYSTPFPDDAVPNGPADASSLWKSNRASLFGERRATRRGDILTVVIEIDDKAEISNSTGRSRSSNDQMGIPDFFGLPQNIEKKMPEGATMDNAVGASSSSKYKGDGSVSRKEKLTLRVAATVVQVLPNGIMQIEGQQEVRVNFELRELIVSGFVRPIDITRQNEITYDKIAGARISYGGRGQITDVQQPRYGQQITDIILPY